MAFDPKDYLSYLDDFDASDEEKIAVIESMWTLAQGFADRAFGLTAGQQHASASDSKIARKTHPELVHSKPVDTAPKRAANDNEPHQELKGTAQT